MLVTKQFPLQRNKIYQRATLGEAQTINIYNRENESNVVNVYIKPTRSEHEYPLDELAAHLLTVNTTIIGGDFIICTDDLPNPQNSLQRSFASMILDTRSSIYVINEPTRFNRKVYYFITLI